VASVDSDGPQLDGGGIIDAQNGGRRGAMVIMKPEGGESAQRCRKNTSADDKRWRRPFAVTSGQPCSVTSKSDLQIRTIASYGLN
jgi:hypothetical protein